MVLLQHLYPFLDPKLAQFAHVASRLASFAAGCLGTSSPAKTGSRLGVMGNVSEEHGMKRMMDKSNKKFKNE